MKLPPLKENTLPELLHRSVRSFGDRPALGYAGEKASTYRDIEEKVSYVASFLRNNGINEGDRVAILSENSPNWGAVFFGITSLKAIAVPILNDFHPTEIHHILRHSGSTALFVSERLYHKVEEFDLKGLNVVILIDNLSVISPDWGKDRLRRLYAEGSRELKRIMDMALKLAGLTSRNVPEDAIASIIYTSGTTGHSKGVMLNHGNIVSNAIGLDKIVSVDHNDRLLSILPLPHVYECSVGLVMPMMIGASVYYVDKPPTAPVLLPALKQVQPTVMLSVPLIIEKMYKARIMPEIQKKPLLRMASRVPALRKMIHRKAGRKLMQVFGGSLRMFPIGGASIAPEVERFMKEARFPYAVGYGLTETSPIVTGSNEKNTRLYSVGKPLDGTEVKIDYNYSDAGITDDGFDPHKNSDPTGASTSIDTTGASTNSDTTGADDPQKSKIPDSRNRDHHNSDTNGSRNRDPQNEDASGSRNVVPKSLSRSGKVGEIMVRGPGVMNGYYNDPELTATVLSEDGWFRTGDLGSFDKDGYLYIRGRLKNLILGPSGENIYPEAIESVLHRSEYVLESLVYHQDKRLVARVHLNYEKLDEELQSKGRPQSEVRDFIKKLLVSLRDETNANVAAFSKLSEVIEQTEPFEKTPTHKIKRYLYVRGE